MSNPRRVPAARSCYRTCLIALLMAPGLGATAEGAFAYRKPLTIQGARVSGAPHASHPVLVSLVDPNLRTTANGGRVRSASGYDIAFMLPSTGALLDHEIESYDGVTGTLVAWVRIPSLTAVDQTVFIYYGDPEITSAQTNPANVWDASYTAVWHLSEAVTDEATGAIHADSTANNRDGTQSRNDDLVGKIARAQDFDGNDHINLGTAFPAVGATFTIEGWAWFDGLASFPVLVAREEFTNLDYRVVHDTGSCAAGGRLRVDISYDGSEPGDAQGCPPGVVATGQWYHFAAVKSATDLRMYLNGVSGAATATAGTVNNNPALETRLALRQEGAQGLDGRLDEVRVSDIARPAGWIQTTFNNHDCPSTSTCGVAANRFVVEGAEQVVPTNYRSIGNTTTPYSTGSVNPTTGSTIVFGTGTAWRTANRGRGDTITFGAFTGTILSVDSETQLTLVSPSTVTGPFGVYAINRKFATPELWERCIDGPPSSCGPDPVVASASLIADDRREVGIVYNDSVYAAAGAEQTVVTISASTTGPAHTITLTADAGNRHNGIPGAGVVFEHHPATLDYDVIPIHDPWVTVEWIEVRGGTGVLNDGIEIAADAEAGKVTIRNNLVHVVSNGIQLESPLTDVEVYNNIVYGGASSCIEIDVPPASALISNNTLYNCERWGVRAKADPAYIPAVPCDPNCTYPTVLLRNNLAYSVQADPEADYLVPGFNPSSSNNLSGDASAPGASPYPNVPLSGAGGINFVDSALGNLHLQTSAPASFAIDKGVDLGSLFRRDIDGVTRLNPWEVGADDVSQLTAVTLMSFEASGVDGAVELAWRTGSELHNLGFHLYRSLSEAGPWTRLTPSLVPGLGSSAVGQAYSFRDAGLVNGTRYYYRLEDVDTASKATSHGPVFAAPTAAGGAAPNGGAVSGATSGKQKGVSPQSCPDWVVAAYGSMAGSPSGASLGCTRHGDPEAVSLGVVSRDARSATLELRTGGFYALREPSGGVRVFVPGFDFPQDPQAASLPFRRALVDAVVGRRVQLGGVRALDQVGFPGLVPAALGKAEMQVSRDGTVRAGRRAVRALTLERGSSELARLLPSVFQGETKSAVVEISPLRFDARRQQLLLARRVRVRLLFTGRETGESGRGSLGRREKPGEPVTGELLARLYTTSRGLHAVSFEQLFLGRRRGFAAAQLRLERQGQAQGFHLEPASDSFGPGSYLYFHADTAAGSADFSSETAWELVRSREGVSMPLVSAAPSGGAVTSASSGQVSFEVNRFYQPGLLDAPDLWLWEGLGSGATRAKSFSLTGVDTASSRTGELDIVVQGASESGRPVDHHLSVSLNGALVGEAQFAGKRPYRMRLGVPVSLLREGTNELSLTNVADTGVASYAFLDRFAVGYPQKSSLAGGAFEGTWSEAGNVEVTGVLDAVAVLDVTAAGAAGASGGAWWLSGYQATGGSLRFRAEAGHRYLAVSRQALLAPRVALPAASSLRSTENQADYILIAPRAFLISAEPLLERRRDQGLQARGVAFEEIADEFGHGQPSAEAIKSFLAFAFHSWTRPSPRYVLLVGDSTYDPRNFTSTAQPSPLPALWAKTSYLWTVSDPQLAAVNGDDALPDMAIGRLPAATVEEAQTLVGKLLAWEDSGQGLSGQAALVADNPDLAGDFDADIDDIARSFFQGRGVSILKLSQLGAQMRPAIREAMNSGLSFLSYVGHGGAAVWASENVWNSWDAPSLQAQSQQPLLLTLNCLNGYFVAPAFNSLSESLLKAEGRGAIAAFSPSGLSLDGPAHQYHRALMAELTGAGHERLGDAILAAQKAYAQTGLMPELLNVYHLLGDPALRIR